MSALPTCSVNPLAMGLHKQEPSIAKAANTVPDKSRKKETSSGVAAQVTPAEAICEALSFRSSFCKLTLI